MRLAARFAAKEATIKALPGGGDGIALTTIEVRSDPRTGEVGSSSRGRAAELAGRRGSTNWRSASPTRPTSPPPRSSPFPDYCDNCIGYLK